MGRKATGPSGIAGLPKQKKFCEARGLYCDTGFFGGPLLNIKKGDFDVNLQEMSFLSRFRKPRPGQRSRTL